MRDFVTRILPRVDALMASAEKHPKHNSNAVPKRHRERILPFGALKLRKKAGALAPRSAA
jgi:hypothetical protein